MTLKMTENDHENDHENDSCHPARVVGYEMHNGETLIHEAELKKSELKKPTLHSPAAVRPWLSTSWVTSWVTSMGYLATILVMVAKVVTKAAKIRRY